MKQMNVMQSDLVYRAVRGSFGRSVAENYALSHGQISWSDLTFHFEARPKIFTKARTRGLENRICRLARSNLSSGGSALDVGARYGFVSHVFGLSVRPGESVYSFEIDELRASVFSRSVIRNRLTDTINVIARGAGAKTEGCFVSVDDSIRDEPISFMKIDINGDELTVLRGSAETLKRWHPVIVVELNGKQDEIVQFLQSMGYSCFMDLSNRRILPGEPCSSDLIASVDPVRIP